MAQGELLRRMEANISRLEQSEYKLEYIHAMDGSDWPGDYRGRTLLAMTQLSRTLGEKCSGLDALSEDTLIYLGKKGYGGSDVDLCAVNEQQLAGHSWLLRALLAYGEYASDHRFDEAAVRLFENLFLAVSGRFGTYPMPDTLQDVGGPSGSILGTTVDNWLLSSDSGCVFIALDGLSDYYARTGDERARNVFDALNKRFLELDPVKVSFQTHATLTALRGLMRMYGITREACLLETSATRFEQYLKYALTLNYANYNWFGRPRWTECCAVVDSYILSMDLWREGLGDRYVEIAERILYNGLMAGQRPNGGFGSDCCLTPDGSITRLVPHPECYEAFWCCSMRGAEGLTRAALSSVHYDGHTIHITGWHPGRYMLDDICVEIRGNFPWENRGTITVTGCAPQYDLRLYPADAPIEIIRGDRAVIREEMPFTQSVRNGGILNVAFDLSERKTIAGAGKVQWKGPLMLDQQQRAISHRMYLPENVLKAGMKIIN